MSAGLGGAVAGEFIFIKFCWSHGFFEGDGADSHIRAQDQGRGGHVLSGKNASESFSMISTPFRYGVAPGDAALEKESGDGDSVILRPSKLLPSCTQYVRSSCCSLLSLMGKLDASGIVGQKHGRRPHMQ